MASPFRDYLIGLSVIVAAAGGYQVTAAKWLEPPVVEHAPIARRPLADHDQSLADLYPADAWQRGRAIRLKTQDGMLLFQNWERDKDERDGGKKWRLWPITMVIGRGLSADESPEPILIEAAEGAVIEFSAALDVMSGVAPTIQRGQLLGEVHIQRVRANESITPNPAQASARATQDDDAAGSSAYHLRRSASSASDDQTLDIRTANVGIDRRKIWTTEAIEMHVGRAVIVGRDLTLHLAASQGSPTSKSNLARSLDRLELIYLRELTLPLGKSNDPNSSGTEEDRGVVEVHCDGRIEYDFAMDQLLLDRNVRLVHRSRNAEPAHSAYRAAADLPASAATPIGETTPDLDQFECSTLRLTLRDPLNSSRERATALDWIDRMEATGSPLRLSMDSQQFDLTAGEILFDPLQGWLVARSQSNPEWATGQRGGSSPETDTESVVRIRRGDMHAALSQIVYRFDPKVPQQLGSVEVDGGGRVDYVALDSVFKSFSWRESLRVAPLDVATPDDLNVRFGVWCEGAIRSLLADGGSFETDRIEGVIKPTVPTSTPISQSPQDEATSPATLDQRWFPDRFAAIGNVRIRSRSLHANTPQMNLFFEQRADPPSPGGDAVSPDGDAAEESSSIRNWVSQPKAAVSEGGGAVAKTNEKPKPTTPPATIRGDQVTAKLTFGNGELTATDLSVVGNVKVTHSLQLRQQQSTSPAADAADNRTTETMTAVMTGDQLRLRDSGGSGDVLQLGSKSETPARLELGDGYFVGPEIQVRPNDNYIWIPSAGEFVVPTAFLPALGDSLTGTDSKVNRGVNDPASATRWTQSPRGRFGGSMMFDGRVAKLGGGVRLQAAIAQGRQPSELKMRGDELTFTLETPVDLRSPGTFRATQLSQISLRQTSDQPVELHVDRYGDDGARESRHEMVVSELTWIPGQVARGESPQPSEPSPLDGQIVAPGPGSYRGWFRTPPPKPDPADVATDRSSGAAHAAVYNEGMIEDDRAGIRLPVQQATGASSAPSITGVHLVYQDGMRGDLVARSLTFDRGVRIGRKVVSDFNTRFDAIDMDLLDQDELTLDCDQLRLAVDPTVAVQKSRFAETARSSQSNVALEVQASGGIVFRARTDQGLTEATADRCGYAVAKDLVSIVGVPGRPARFRQTNMSGKPVDAALRSITLRLDPFTVLSSQVESVSTGLLPADFPTKR